MPAFLCVGGVVFCIDAGLMRLTWGMGVLPLEWALRLGYAVGLCFHFLLNRRLTFKAHAVSAGMSFKQGTLYATGVLMCYAVTELIVRSGHGGLGFDPLIWKAVAVGVTMLISFTWMSCVVFHKKTVVEPVVILGPLPLPAQEPEFVVQSAPVER